MSKVTIVNDSKLGSQPVMSKSHDEHVKLNFPEPNKRTFPHEGKLTVGNIDKQPCLVSNGRGNAKNGWTNNYSSSVSGITTKLGKVNNLY